MTTPTSNTSDPPLSPPPSLGAHLGAWVSVGLQSFGGGSSTFTLIERTFVYQRGWLTEEELARYWALCQLAPGINLIALAILIGHRLGGTAGVVVALAGMLVPSIAVTILMTAFYARARQSPWVQAALRGIIPATVGIGLLTAFRMAVPLLRIGQRSGMGMSILSVLVLVASGAAVLLGTPVIGTLIAAGVVAAAVSWVRRSSSQAEEPAT